MFKAAAWFITIAGQPGMAVRAVILPDVNAITHPKTSISHVAADPRWLAGSVSV